MAVSACLGVSRVLLWISSALMVSKKVSMAGLSYQLPLSLIRWPAADVYIRKRGRLEPVLTQDIPVVVRTVLTAPADIAPWI